MIFECQYCRDWKGIKSQVQWDEVIEPASHRVLSCNADYKHYFVLSVEEAEKMLSR